MIEGKTAATVLVLSFSSSEAGAVVATAFVAALVDVDAEDEFLGFLAARASVMDSIL